MIYYFSATGNSKAVAEMLASRLSDKVTDITPLLFRPSVEYALGAEESLGFVFPIHGWSLPSVIRKFFNKLTVTGYRQQYVYFVVTCGDDIGIADRHIRQAMPAGLSLSAGYSVTMPDSYVCLPGFDVDSDEVRHRKFAQLPSRLNEIADSISARRAVMDVHHGSFAWIKTKVLGAVFRRYMLHDDKLFHTVGVCGGCGTCVVVCPLNNISFEENRPRWNGKCIGCLACYHHCPIRGIRYGHRTRHKGQYSFSKYADEVKE